MTDQSYFHWDLFRPPIHSPSFAMGPSFFDIREEAMRGMPNKAKTFTFDQSCALWSKDIGLDPGEGLQNVGGRVLEIRKEKSRDAARSRRGKENYEFYELAKLLPLPAAITSQLDKASIIRLSISYLKLRDFCGHGDPPWPRDGAAATKALKGGQRRRSGAGVPVELFELHQGAHILQSLDGFAFTLSTDGRFLYISETVSIYLGLSQVEMAGSSMFDYVHTQDHQELADQLGLSLAGITSSSPSPSSPTLESPTTSRSITPTLPDRVPVMAPNLEKGGERTFCIRMKSTLTKRGVHIRTSGYRVLLIVGQFRHQVNFGLGRKGTPPLLGLAGVAIALPPPTITELRLEADTFIMRLTTELKIIYCENMISNLTDWKCEELCGRDLYKFCHPGDIHYLRKIHTDLLLKGQVLSPSIRLLNKGGGYIWVQVCGTSLYNTKTSEDQTILAIFQTISSIEHRGVVMDAGQLDPPMTSQATRDADKASVLNQSDESPIMSPPAMTPPIMSPPAISTPTAEVSQRDSPSLQTEDSSSIFPDSVENDFLLEDHAEEMVKVDNKISRRKTERPRKRKRESNECSSVNETELELTEAHGVDVDKAENNILNLSSNRSTQPSSPHQNDRASLVSSPQLPEDLSFRSIDDKVNHPVCDVRHSADITGEGDLMSSSVQELEKAMNRHLPSRVDLIHGHHVGEAGRNVCEAQRAALFWTGTHVSEMPTPIASRPIPDESLVASAFLRHLYTNRDTVIRSNGRPNFFNGDVNALNMLTPPNTDACKDQLHLNIPHISVQSKGHVSNMFKDQVSNTDEFSMTPPSSVSPDDVKMTSPFPDAEPECLNMRLSHGNQSHNPSSSKAQSFQTILEHDTDLPKSHFPPTMPNYVYHGADMNHFSHFPGSGAGGGAMFESRPEVSHGMWFGSAYSS